MGSAILEAHCYGRLGASDPHSSATICRPRFHIIIGPFQTICALPTARSCLKDTAITGPQRPKQKRPHGQRPLGEMKVGWVRVVGSAGRLGASLAAGLVEAMETFEIRPVDDRGMGETMSCREVGMD